MISNKLDFYKLSEILEIEKHNPKGTIKYISNIKHSKNIGSKIFSVVISIVPVCSLLCGACIYGNALGYKVNVENIMPVFMGVLFLVLGFILPKCKQNYTIGIKLPWTLHDEENWDKTHKLAGKIWIAGGIIMTIAGLFNLTFLFMAIIFALVIIPTVYSFLIYKNKK